MNLRKLAAAVIIAAGLTGWQAKVSEPSLAALMALKRNGFTAIDAAALNESVSLEDIRTTAFYLCGEARCGGFSLVFFGVDPAGAAGPEDLKTLANTTRARVSDAAAKALASIGISHIKVLDVATPRTADGTQLLTITLRGRSARAAVFLRLTMAYRDGPGRMVAALSPRRSLAVRLGGPAMLGL